ERHPGIVHPCEVLGFVLLEQALDELDDAPRGRRVLSTAGGEGARDHGEERPVDQGVSIDEKKPRGWRQGWSGRCHCAKRAGLGANGGITESSDCAAPDSMPAHPGASAHDWRSRAALSSRPRGNSTARHFWRAGAGCLVLAARKLRPEPRLRREDPFRLFG